MPDGKFDISEHVTETIIAEIEKGVPPWRRSLGGDRDSGHAVPAAARQRRALPGCQCGDALAGGRHAGIWVYPCACGRTRGRMMINPDPIGLSPRVRGNSWIYPCGASESRSIPARAGEPHSTALPYPRPQLYPRACGGTDRRKIDVGQGYALSPRVRGNRCL